MTSQRLEDLTEVDMKVYPTHECKSNCPFCMTDLRWKNPEASTEEYLSNFKKAFEAYFNAGGRKVLFTGGEPTERPDKLIGMLDIIKDYPLDLAVLYTNGTNLFNLQRMDLIDPHDGDVILFTTLMEALIRKGLKNYNISVHHYDASKRQELSSIKVCDIETICEKAETLGANVRLNCTLMKDYIGNSQEVMNYVEYARSIGVRDIYFRD